MTDEEAQRREHLEAAADTVMSPTQDVVEYLDAFYRMVTIDDLLATAPAELAGAALSLRELADPLPSPVSVRVFTPSVAREGWSSGHTVVQIATGDAPFLIDSMLEEFEHQGCQIHFIAHPQLLVRRDEAGALREVVGFNTGGGRDDSDESIHAESWTHVEIDRRSEPVVEGQLAGGLRAVVRDVHAAVADAEAMRERARQVQASLRDDVPGVSAQSVAEARALLDWVMSDLFVCIGAADYRLEEAPDELPEGAFEMMRAAADGSPPSPGTRRVLLHREHETGLGVLSPGRADGRQTVPVVFAGASADRVCAPDAYVFTKANSVSTVHRRARLEYIGIKRFDETGRVIGEHRWLGLFTAPTYVWSVTTLPYVKDKVDQVMRRSGYQPESHLGQDLLGVLEAYPREDLFHDTVEHITEVATQVVHMRERRRTRLFLRIDSFGRYVTALVYLPRDRYNTEVRVRIQELLKHEMAGSDVEFRTHVGESSLAQIYCIVHGTDPVTARGTDVAELEKRIVELTRTWDESFAEYAGAQFGEENSSSVLARYRGGFPADYEAAVPPRVAVSDVAVLEGLPDSVGVKPMVHRLPGAPATERRLKLYARQAMSLSDLMPVLRDLGVRVTDERPYELRRTDGITYYLYDIGLSAPEGAQWLPGPDDGLAFEEAFTEVWDGHVESDGLNALVLLGGLSIRDVVVLRTLCSYIAQAGSTFSRTYVQEALIANTEIAGLLVRLFTTRFSPEAFEDGAADPQRAAAVEDLRAQIEEALENVASLDEDTILRRLLSVIDATVRTNYWAPRAGITCALKLRPGMVRGIPEPVPAVEVWVYSPQVEGTHLRFGPVSRGGLRWSDRREDFRTEVLGLVKAQMVKNALIVPTGSKGGFFAKQLPDPSDREAWQAEGVSAYRAFIGALLDLTDNRVGGRIEPPARVLRYDDDDPYLVVAADKGTARFSDIANEIAESYGFWLGDAFASGGSAGYDHKGMGITARGAWVSVQRHFRELGVDVQSEEFTVVGIGDMSGDVFGNGMLRSEHIRLVAAFDHRHVFVDPEPDAAATFAERQRLFDLPRSSWDDFDRDLISEGGGVFPRTAKSVEVTEQMAAALGLGAPGVMTPNDLVQAVLRAPVDLLWNGGIGTYVKSSAEANAEVGDRANDSVRVNGGELRAKVVGEGGNLGFSQLGRIEAARTGVLINTDAIDNAAGVNTSDHEVNIKILLRAVEEAGDITRKQRNELLASMTDTVAHDVLRDNYEQNVLLANARASSPHLIGPHAELLRSLEEHGGLDRALEHLPDEAQMDERREAGDDLTSPEMCVLVGYTKLALKEELAAGHLPDDPWLDRYVADYFPATLSERYGDQLASHPLRRDIVVNVLANSIVNKGGLTFVHRCATETTASVSEIAAAYVVASEVFGQQKYHAQVEALDNVVPPAVQASLYLAFRRLMDRNVRWALANRRLEEGIEHEIEHFASVVQSLIPRVPELLVGSQVTEFEEAAQAWIEEGVPEELARRAAALMFSFSLLDVAEISRGSERAGTSHDLAEVAACYFAALGRVRVGELLVRVSDLASDDHWESLARQSMRDDLYDVLRSITLVVLESTDETADPVDRVEEWADRHEAILERVDDIVEAIDAMSDVEFAPVSVAVRSLRGVVRVATAGR